MRNLTYKLRKFKDILNDCLIDCIQQDEKLLVSMVRDIQLYERGENGKAAAGRRFGDGVPIMSYKPYMPRTIKNKKKKNQPYDRVTLKDSGAFYRSMYVEVDEDGFSIEASDKKTAKLKEKYGDEILRLSDFHFKQYLDLIRKYRLMPMLKAKMMEGVK